MKILWLCNCVISESDPEGTGTWLGTMARGLLDSKNVELEIITVGPVNQFSQCNYRNAKQWILPSNIKLGRNYLPKDPVLQSIILAANQFSPDLVHVWGTETFWGLLTARSLLKYPSLLEIQGLKGAIAKVYYGGLTLPEQLHCIGIKELIKLRTMHSDQRNYCRWRSIENEILKGHKFVDVQTAWARSYVQSVNPTTRLFDVDLPLRKPFYHTNAWTPPSHPTLFCMAAYSSPFKGLHTVIRALGLLKKRIPNIRLRIAGAHQRQGIRQDGYIRWINRMISQLGLSDAIEWLGPIDAKNIVAELQNSSAIVIPTFIENCCTSMQEAMAIGTPIVVSYVGGIPSLAQDEESCLFFPAGDEAMCAYQLERLLTNRELAECLAIKSRKIAADRNNYRKIIERQLEIYRQILNNE